MFIFLLALSRFRAIETPNFYIYYRSKDSVNAVKAGFYLEKYKFDVDYLTGGRPEKPHIFIEDVGTLSNGYTDPLSNSISLFTYFPHPDFQFGSMKSWWRTVSVHEYTHLSHLTNVKFPVTLFRPFVGKFYLPNMLFLPTYMHEGIAVYSESMLDPYEGRLNEGFFDAYTRILAKKRKIPTDVYINHLPTDYPYGHLPYLIGGEFTEFIAKKYGEAKLRQYYNTLAHFPFTVPIIDLGGLLVFKRRMSDLYRDWKNSIQGSSGYDTHFNNVILKGYRIKYLVFQDHKLYLVKENLQRLSGNYIYNASEVWCIDYESGEKRKLFVGDFVSLPLRVKDSGVYFGISEPSTGGNNISYQGIQFKNTIVKLEKSGKLRYLASGRIRTFDVKGDTVFFVEEKGPKKSMLYALYEGKIKPIREFYNVTVREIVIREDGKIFLNILSEDGKNEISALENDSITKILSFPFSVGSLNVKGDTLYFSANYENRWRIYFYNIKTGEITCVEDEYLAYYPAISEKSLYYVTIDRDGELVKVKSLENAHPIKFDLEDLENQSKVELKDLTYKHSKFPIAFLKEGLWHDYILPISFPPILWEMAWHTPLNLFESFLYLNIYELRNFQFNVFFNGIPCTSLGFEIGRYREDFGLSMGRIIYLSGKGFLRQDNFYFESYPFQNIFAISNLTWTRIPAFTDQYLGLSFIKNGANTMGKITDNIFVPIPELSLIVNANFSYSYSFSEKASEKSFDLRLTSPLFKINWGNNSIIHFFIERNFITLEAFYTKSEFSSDSNSLGAVLSLDHLFSVMSGNLKLVLRTGITFYPPRWFAQKPALYLKIEPATFNFFSGMFKKRWILKQILGLPNLI